MGSGIAACVVSSLRHRQDQEVPLDRSQTAAPHPVLILITTVLASSLAFIDGSVVNVALPAIENSQGGGAEAVQWLVTGYLLPLSALLMFGGSLGDRYGRRRILVLGVVLFAVASAACGLAPSLAVLIAARFVQGIGAALLMPSSLALLGDAFAGQARGRAIGIWASAGAAMGAVGPVLGGWLVDAISWRMIFAINVPIAAAAVVLARRYVPVDPGGETPPLDVPGAILATFGLAVLTWGLTVGAGQQGWTWLGISALGIGAGALMAFVIWEGHRGQAAMMPLAMFGSRSFIGLTLLTLLLYGALGGLLVLLPYVLIKALAYSGTAAGAALLPLPLILSVLSPLVGKMAGRVGPRPLLVVGPLVAAAGFMLMVRIGPNTGYWAAVFPSLAIMSIGLALAVAPLTTAVLGSVDSAHTGSASGLNSAIARTGGLIGTALLGTVLASHGLALVGAFHAVALVAACTCVAAALSGMVIGPVAGDPRRIAVPEATNSSTLRRS
jgi:EmrB/QacA subfamily drug resistance transporter